MTYGEYGPLVVGKEFREQVQRFHIEVVSRFIQYQHIARMTEQACQQQAISFAA